MKIGVAVMAHPSREGRFNYLRAKLPEGTPIFVDDESRGAWWNARRAWAHLAVGGTDWSVLIQDDAIVCNDFIRRVEALLVRHGGPLSLYFGAAPKYVRVLRAPEFDGGAVTLRGSHILPTGVCLVLPTSRLREMLRYASSVCLPPADSQKDDLRVVAWLRASQLPLVYPVPSLVDHAGELGSLFAGHKGVRRAYRFIDDARPEPSVAPDVVYPLGPHPIRHPELRYSLRSLANVDHGHVWVFGSRPRWAGTRLRVVPVPCDTRPGPNHLPFPHEAKWSSILRNFEAATEHPEVSSSFILMNDDMIISHRLPQGIPTMHRGTFTEAVEWRDPTKGYTHMLQLTADELRRRGIVDPLSYELHSPMLVDKEEFGTILRGMPHERLLYRSLYGNLYHVGGERVRDCKVFPPHVRDDPEGPGPAIPAGPFVSFSDAGFSLPQTRTWLSSQFSSASPYER